MICMAQHTTASTKTTDTFGLGTMAREGVNHYSRIRTEHWRPWALAGVAGSASMAQALTTRRGRMPEQDLLTGLDVLAVATNPVTGAVGALARDRNNVPFYLRQGGNFTEAMMQELMAQEEER